MELCLSPAQNTCSLMHLCEQGLKQCLVTLLPVTHGTRCQPVHLSIAPGMGVFHTAGNSVVLVLRQMWI